MWAGALLSVALAYGEPAAPRVYGGMPAQTCQWPTTVAMQGAGSLCTGTLVHPQIVLYASHCEAPVAVRFGETAAAPARTVPIDHCDRFGDGQVGPDDYAYCRLAQAVDDLPIAPVAYGCEVELASPGTPAFIAGFGQTDQGGAGTKHWAQTEVVAITQMVLVGKDGTSAWSGDSGGPAFVRVPLDGTWRVFGIASGGTVAGMPIQYVQAFTSVPWVEASSGVDITPCHDADGTWAPTADCGGFARDPMAGGTWMSGCSPDPGAGVSGTCGIPFGDDDAPPAVVVTAPEDGEWIPSAEPVSVAVDASDAETGIRRVWLRVDDEDGAEDAAPPYDFEPLALDDGPHVLVAFAEDLAGNVGESAPVAFEVGFEDSGETGEAGSGGADADGGGCGCGLTPSRRGSRGEFAPALGGGLWAVVVMVARRRRTSAPGRRENG